MSQAKHKLSQAMARIKKIHFVGIGGVGMSGIAEIFNNLGFIVTGSDIKDSDTLNRLEAQGISIFIGHQAQNVQQTDVVVVSTAIAAENPEIEYALKNNIPVIRRAEMLAELMRFRFGIAIAGTHGKTTTTSLLASILTAGGLDPTYVIGGKLASSATNAKLGSGKYLVAEADESDASFMHLKPMLAVVTNIDQDHMQTYAGDVSRLYSTFVSFLHNLPFYGLAVVCIDDPGVKAIINEISRPLITYGFSANSEVRAENLEQVGPVTNFTVIRSDRPALAISLNLPGEHNVLNALAAIAIATELGVDDKSIAGSLNAFAGIVRRFQRFGEFKLAESKVEVIDDYGHHPRELAATITAARSYRQDARLVLVFQPHRYTRTRDLFEDFVKVLSKADVLILLEVYPAGEPEIQGAGARDLIKAVRARGMVEPIFAEGLEDLYELLPEILQDQDLVLFSGAGSIGQAAPKLASSWETVR